MRSGRRLDAGTLVIWRAVGMFSPSQGAPMSNRQSPRFATRALFRVSSSSPSSSLRSSKLFTQDASEACGQKKRLPSERIERPLQTQSRDSSNIIDPTVLSDLQSYVIAMLVSSLVLRPSFDLTSNTFRPRKFRRVSTNKPTPQQSAPSGCTASLPVNYRSILMGREQRRS